MNQTVLLGDIADLKGGFAFRSKDYTDSGRFVLRTVNIGDDGSIHRSGSVFISENNAKGYERFELRVLDTLFVMVGATLGKTGLVRSKDLPALLNQNMWVIRAKPEIVDPLYLYYLFSVESKKLLAYSSGAARDFVRRDDFRKMRLNIPDLKTQKKIADILGTIDEKIELNRRMNETLEQMGQALFRHYFIDNPDAGKWEEKALGDILDLRGGLSYKASFLSNRIVDMPMVTMGCVSARDRINLSALKRYKGEYKDQHILNVGDIFIATRDVTQDRVLIGSPAIIPESLGQAICATNLYKVVLKETVSTEFLYQLMRTKQYREQIIAHAKGSTIVMLTKDSVLDYKFKIEFSSISYADYVQKAEKIRQLIDKNSEQIQTLTALRDTLLPRLIDGKLKI